MEKAENGQTAKGQYHERLLERTCQVYAQVKDLSGYEAEDVIFQALKEVALESWKNGIQTGRRRATQKTAKSTESA